MSKDGSLLDNFVTVTKRLPLKARFLVGLCMVVVVFELISGVVELNGDNYSTGRLRNTRPHDTGKLRERKETNPNKEDIDLEKFVNSPKASKDKIENMVEVKNNVRLKYQKVKSVKKINNGKMTNLTDTTRRGTRNSTKLQLPPQVKVPL